MKPCIYQIAFIAVIMCCSKVMHSYHEHLAKVSGYHLQDLLTQIDSLVDQLTKEATMSEKIHDHVANLNHKEGSLDAQQRSAIRTAQNEADNALVRKRQQIEKAHHYLEKSKEFLTSALRVVQSGNKRTKDALAQVRTANQGSSERAKKRLSKETMAAQRKMKVKNNKYNDSDISDPIQV